tara:strand:- start:4382 stop:4786 length:405 start_codon:yes stop_codon:yes gene_type:complete
MKSALIVGALVSCLTLTACNSVTNRQGGALLGGVAGGILGNQVGGGSGKTVATIGGAILGTIAGSQIGGNIDRQNQQPTQIIVQNPQPMHSTDACHAYVRNQGAYASCKRGVAQRNAELQRRLEREAYKVGNHN